MSNKDTCLRKTYASRDIPANIVFDRQFYELVKLYIR